MSTNQQDEDTILAQLLTFGFDEWICQRAIARTKTVEEATEWILNTLDENSGNRTTSSNNTLVLRQPESSERASAPMMVDTEQLSSAASSSTSKPMLTSRYSDDDSEYTKEAKAKAAKAAEEMKRSKLLEKEARKKTLLAIKEDRENLKLRKISHKADNSSSASSSTLSTLSTPPQKTEQSDSTLIQIRLSTGQAIRQKFLNTAFVSDLFNWVVNYNEPSKKFQLVLPFPRKVFGDDEMGSTLADVGLVPNASLNVVKLDAPSIIAVQTPMNRVTNSITQNDLNNYDSSDDDDDDGDNSIGQLLPNVPNPRVGQHHPPLNLPQQLPPPIPVQQGPPPNLPQQLPPPIPTQPGNPANVFPPIPAQPGIPINVPPLAHGQFPPNMGPPPLNHRMLARPFPFSGTGFRLTNNQPILQQQDSDDDFDDEEKRQRIAEAVQARVHADNSVNDSQQVKHGIKREVKTLKSRCAYCVAVLLTTATSMRTLQSLSNVSADVGELLVNELIKLEKLDVLTFKRFTNCNLQNIILDNYFKASDSLLERISDTQSSSVTKVSLRNCELITDNGFDCLQDLRYLEYLDVVSCRIRDRTLPFFKDFSELRTLNLSKTKVTMNGLRTLFADCAFASTLEDLNLSYCSGVGGKTVFADLQPLQNLRCLNLDSVQLTPPLVPVKPSSFRNLEVLDLSRTRLCDQDVMKIICQFKNMIELILIETVGIGQFGLKWMAKEFKSLNLINFPNREEELDDILQDFSELPLIKMDLTGFINVTDSGIMHLSGAKSLTFLSLSGTKLTDVGMSALKGI
ncbi:RNI-like protein [Gigaspora margarita]|uniref:RNI-like protein n=1 Tax=Gigaspora margarita TaxID=4874 RepID=A0A8H4ANY3_GIGMA|nr:RNI-like protein [Gigaspora margarita]